MTSAQRKAKERQLKKEQGLIRKGYWAKPETHVIANAIISDLEDGHSLEDIARVIIDMRADK